MTVYPSTPAGWHINLCCTILVFGPSGQPMLAARVTVLIPIHAKCGASLLENLETHNVPVHRRPPPCAIATVSAPEFKTNISKFGFQSYKIVLMPSTYLLSRKPGPRCELSPVVVLQLHSTRDILSTAPHLSSAFYGLFSHAVAAVTTTGGRTKPPQPVYIISEANT